jgi:hypothetical protein
VLLNDAALQAFVLCGLLRTKVAMCDKTKKLGELVATLRRRMRRHRSKQLLAEDANTVTKIAVATLFRHGKLPGEKLPAVNRDVRCARARRELEEKIRLEVRGYPKVR